MLVIFSDLDGTLLDYDGSSWQRAGGAVQHVRERRIPLVFTSSKTLQEQMAYQHEMDLNEPMIVESGGAIVVPRGYLPDDVVEAWAQEETTGEGSELTSVGRRWIVGLARSHDQVIRAVTEVREETGIPVRGITEMPLAQVLARSGLTEAMAMRARSREYSELVHLEGDRGAWNEVRRVFEERGFGLHGNGPFATVVDLATDKGRGVRLMTELLRRSGEGRGLETVALGDGRSDVPMFEAVDRAFLVERAGGGWIEVDLPNVEKVTGVGPHGWEPVVRKLLDEPVRGSRPRAPR